MKEWNIGDKVRTLRADEIPQERKAERTGGDPRVWATSKFRLAGAVGEIMDKMHSEAYGEYLYKLRFDGADRVSTALFIGDDLHEIEPEKVDFRVDFEYLDGVVVARAMSGDRQLGIGHGHLLHEGALGLMQAASYAAKRCYMNMGGKFPKKGGE